jgi:hypothetical protein
MTDERINNERLGNDINRGKPTYPEDTSPNNTLSTTVTIWTGKKKVQCTLLYALGLCIGRTAHRGSRGIALLFHDHGTRRG